jgi:uncharacterized protein YjdB
VLNPTPRRTLVLALASVLGTPLFAQSTAQPAQAAATRLVVTPLALRVDVGATGSIYTTAYDDKGSTIESDKYQPKFTVADSTVAAVDSHGLVTGLKAGETQLTVQVNDLLRDVIVTVAPAGAVAVAPTPVQAVRHPRLLQIAPTPILLLPSERARPSVTALYDDGSTEVLTSANWAVFGTTAMFDSVAGDVVGLTPGDAVLGVRSADGTSASAPIEVVPVAIDIARDSVLLEEGAEDTVIVDVPTQSRRRLVRGLNWRTGNRDIVRVLNPVLGIVRAQGAGLAEVIADGYGMSKHLPVRVYKHVERVKAEPDPAAGPIKVAAGAFIRISATPVAADSSPVVGLATTWTVTDTTIATYDARVGRIVGRKAGHTKLEFKYPTLPATTWSIDVADGTFALDHKQARMALVVGTAYSASASYHDAQASMLGKPVTNKWTSSNDAVLAVDTSGAIAAKKVGRATVTVTGPGGVRDSTLVFVTGDVLATKHVSERKTELVTFAIDNPKPMTLADTNQITRDGAWSPDHTRIVYVSDGGTRGDKWTLYVADADGGKAHALALAGDGFEHPTWSPDGQTIAVSMGRLGKRMQLVALNPDSSSQIPKPLGRDRLSLRWATYDSGGASIVALGEHGDDKHVVRVHPNDEVAITTGQEAQAHPVILADGSMLYLSDSAGKGTAWRLMRAASGGAPSVVLASDAIPGLVDFAASRDGQRLVLVSVTAETAKGQKRKRSTLYVVVKPGAAPVPLKPNETDEFSDPAL